MTKIAPTTIIAKPIELQAAEADLAEAHRACATVSAQLGAIDEALLVHRPSVPIERPQRDKLEAERSELRTQFDALRERQQGLANTVREMRCDFGAVLVAGLTPGRRTAAQRIIVAVAELNAALDDLTDSAAVIEEHGGLAEKAIRPPLLDGLRKQAEIIGRTGGARLTPRAVSTKRSAA